MDRIDREQLKRNVIFAILMENGDGIKEKSPAYIMEKFHAAMTGARPETLLDPQNTHKLETWIKSWLPPEGDVYE